MTRHFGWPAAAALAVQALIMPATVVAAPITFSDSGLNPLAIQDTVDAFRAALGDPNNMNNPGPLATGRREINWDGGSLTNFATTAPVTPFDVFLNTRGAQFTTPGTGLTQAPPSADPLAFPPGGLAGLFSNPDYATAFTTFSAARLFAPVGSNITDGFFFLPGSSGSVPATVSGFGAVFADVDLPGITSIEYFDALGGSLGTFFVPAFPGTGTLSFLGVIFDAGEQIRSVRITTGNAPLGPNANDSEVVDVVALDDFLYSEPQAVPEPASLSLLLLGAGGLAAVRRRMKGKA